MTLKSNKKMNRLAGETSPYLLQHAGNPVDWFPWGEEAFEQAARENRLVLVSIGYAACHWCHVMEKESFENEELAGIMNREFVCIKVDREERPDVDQLYMDALQLLTGSGGWPLNMFVLPDKRPVYGGTYFRPAQWREVLQALAHTWKDEKQKVLDAAGELSRGLIQMEMAGKTPQKGERLSARQLESYVASLKKTFDPENGGMLGAPKFPLPPSLDFLLHYGFYADDGSVLDQVYLSLEKMALGGLYDWLGGGFARYTVDNGWKIPHFEKMLYDNAQLLELYSLAYLHRPDPFLESAIRGTVKFLETELRSEEGWFYASLDADSEGEEGRYYVWTHAEINDILGQEATEFMAYFHILPEGNWEGKNILRAMATPAAWAGQKGLHPESFRAYLETCRTKLLKVRHRRIRPGLDNKGIVSWNALVVKGLLEASRALSEPAWVLMAGEAAEVLLEKATEPDGKVYRLVNGKEPRVNGFLDDYAFLADALIRLYQSDYNARWLHRAFLISGFALEHFSHEGNPWFYYTPAFEPLLVARKTEMNDNVLPSSNGIMARNLWLLGTYFSRPDWKDRAGEMLKGMASGFNRPGYHTAGWARLGLWQVWEPVEWVMAGEGAKGFAEEMASRFLPGVFPALAQGGEEIPLLEGRDTSGEPKIYVCRDGACFLPAAGISEALKNLPYRERFL